MTSTDWDLLSSYAGLLSLAVTSIYAGAFGSLPNPPRVKGQKSSNNTDSDDEDEEDSSERLSSEDAWLFPVIGSVALLSLYGVVKYFGTEWINWALAWYFSFIGVGSLWKSSISLARFTIGTTRWKQFDNLKLVLKKGPTVYLSASCRTPSLFLFPIAAIPSIAYTLSNEGKKSVLITNILALSFTFNALSLLKIDSFKTGSILLSGLFFYDIWWVFGTEVMVKVATNLDVPIKLQWAKSLVFSSERGFTMLGLGDIVLPGAFIALALRYDHHRFISKPNSSFRKPYFYVSLVGYILGLTTTMAVMHIFQAAQPALLYLSPACILSFFFTALVRGELAEAWAWKDDPDVELEKQKKVISEPRRDSGSQGSFANGTALPGDTTILKKRK